MADTEKNRRKYVKPNVPRRNARQSPTKDAAGARLSPDKPNRVTRPRKMNDEANGDARTVRNNGRHYAVQNNQAAVEQDFENKRETQVAYEESHQPRLNVGQFEQGLRKPAIHTSQGQSGQDNYYQASSGQGNYNQAPSGQEKNAQIQQDNYSKQNPEHYYSQSGQYSLQEQSGLWSQSNQGQYSKSGHDHLSQGMSAHEFQSQEQSSSGNYAQSSGNYAQSSGNYAQSSAAKSQSSANQQSKKMVSPTKPTERHLSNSIAIDALQSKPHSARTKTTSSISNSSTTKQTKEVKTIPVASENIDETGEKARLLAVRRLDTPEPRRKNGDDESDLSSTLTDASQSKGDVFLPKRYILSIMMFMGFMNMYAIRVNLNVAIGAMTNNHTVVQNGVAVTMPPEFNWSSRLQGVVLGSFYYGYMFLQVPGGWFAMRFGGTKIFGGAVFVASILTLFTPFATRYNVWALVVLRVLEGLVLGVMLPCNHQIWSLWAPLQERSTLVTIAVAGMNVGTVVTMPLTGLLTKYGFDGGWASVFYCFGLFGIAWYLLWLLVVHATPDCHPTISKEERSYINRNVIKRKSMSVPWKAILTSGPVWAVVIGNVASDWGLYTILICLPLFLMDIMHFNVQTMGFIASLPFLLKAIVGPLGGVLADLLRFKCMSTVNVRRIFYAVGAMAAAVMIVVAGYSHTPAMAVLSMCVGVALSGLLHSGYEVNMLDIAPSLGGIVMGISNSFGTTTGFISPLVVGFLTEDKLRSQWQLVFWITFFIYLGGTILFCALCSGEAQHWAMDDDDEDDNTGASRRS